MTLWINELSFPNAKVVHSTDTIGVSVTPVHSSNFPDVQTLGVTDPGFEIEVVVNTSDVNRILSQLRGSIRNKEFTVFRSDTQNLRDNKKIVFVKVTSIRPVRSVGATYNTTITIGGKYVGTQQSHQPNFFINSVVIPNDWSKMGLTSVALPVGSSSINQTINSTIANHSFIVSPTWATVEEAATYSGTSVCRGTIGFNLDFTQMHNNTIRLYDGPVVAGSHITDLDEEITFSGGYVTVRQDNFMELVFSRTSGWIQMKPYVGGTYTSYAYIYPNSGQGYGALYVHSLSDNYIRVALDSEDEVEMFSCKVPSMFPGTRNPYISGTSIYQGVVSGNSAADNFIQVRSSTPLWIASNRYFNVQNSGSFAIIKPDISATTTGDMQYWFGWESNTTAMRPRFNQVLRRLE